MGSFLKSFSHEQINKQRIMHKHVKFRQQIGYLSGNMKTYEYDADTMYEPFIFVSLIQLVSSRSPRGTLCWH
jgi:hypothetical protein